MSKPFVRLLHLYAFHDLKDKDWFGIWETTGVVGIKSTEPMWNLVLVLSGEGGRKVGTKEIVPERFIDEYGYYIDRSALWGKQCEK